ncbi:MAG: gliding motility-associated C-terminal domain-containing protein [Bacteroidota bacterium]
MRTNPNSDFTISTTTPFSIPSTSGLYVDLPANTGNRNILIGNAANNYGDLSLSGKLTIINGNVYVGRIDGTDISNNDIEYTGNEASAIEVQGGNLTVNGQIRRQAATNGVLNYTQSGGSVIINGNNALDTKAKLEVLNTGSVFNMSGGTLTIVRGGGTTFGDLYLRPGSSSVTGGTIVFSHNLSGISQTYGLDANIPLNNITITGRTAATAANATVNLMVSPLELNGSLTLSNINSIFNSNSLNVSLKGDMNNSGDYIYGTNLTTFNGGFQYVTGTTPTNFYDLDVSPVNSLTVSNNFTVNRNLTVRSGNFILGTNKVTLLGDLINNGSYTDNNTGSGISLTGASQQQITGSGAFGRLELNNASGAKLNSDISLQNDLALTLGVLDINANQLTLSQNSLIEGTPFGVTKMIKSDGVISNLGVVKFFTAEAQSFTFPVGITGKYTPASFTITASEEVGSIGVNPVNNKHSSITGDALNYYWQIKSSGISGFDGNILLQYLPGDVVGTESEYVAARLALPGSYWYLAPSGTATDNVNETTHRILFENSGSSNLTGDYTAGISTAFPSEVPTYQTISDGDWSDETIWSPACPDGGPVGANVIIDHEVTMDINNIFALSTTINNKLIVDPPNYSHNLGVVTGDGTIYLTGGNLPAGNYSAFTDCSGNGTIEYGGTGTYTIIATLFSSVPNMLFTGTGTRILPNKDLTICKKLVIDGPILDNSVNNSKLTILGTMERYNTGAFISGTGPSPASTVSFAGAAVQTLGGSTGDFSGANKFNNLEINNAAGLNIGTNGLIEVNNELLLTTGIIHTTTSNKLILLSTSSSVAVPTGGSASSFVDGPLIKWIINGGSFQFPIGKGTTNGHSFTLTSTAGSTLAWTAECFIPNPIQSLTFPLIAYNTGEYWSVNTTGAASAKIKIGWDRLSDLTPLMLVNGLSDMRVAELNSGSWNELASVATGDISTGDVASTSSVSINTSPANFTSACITRPKGRALLAPTGPVCGTTGIPVRFTSFFPIDLNYTLDYTIDDAAQEPLTVESTTYSLPTPIPGAYKLTGFSYFSGGEVIAGVVDGEIINVYASPPDADAGPDQLSLCGVSGALLAGNSPASYSGLWTKVSGAGGTFINNTLNNTYFTGSLGKTYTLRWTISNVSCISSDDVVISFPVEAAKPSDFTSAPIQVCLGSGGYVYSVPNVIGNTYNWTYSGSGYSINGTGNSVTMGFNPTATSGTLSVTTTNGCGTSAARTVDITVNEATTTATITSPTLNYCDTKVSAALGGNTPTNGTGLWSRVSGPGTIIFSTPTSGTSIATASIYGTYIFQWTISNGTCESSAQVTVNYSETPTTAIITTSPLNYCGTLTSSSLGGNTPAIGSGLWNQVSGPGTTTFSAPASGSSTATATAYGTYVYQWTISNGNCTPSSVQVSVNYYANATIAISQLDYCGTLVSAALGGNTPSSGTGSWTIISGGTGTFSAPDSGSSNFAGTTYGAYVLRWTITNGPCAVSTADVNVTYSQTPTASNAGTDQTGAAMCGLTSTTLAANTPVTGTGSWTIIGGTGGIISAPTNPASPFTGTAGTSYILSWTISNGSCTPSSALVNVSFYAIPTAATITTSPLSSCGTLISSSLGGNTPAVGSGLWSQVSGPGITTFSAPASGSSTATATLYGTYIYQWTISNGNCTPGSAQVTVNYNAAPTASITTSPLNYCGTLVSGALGGNTPSFGIGAWTIISGGTGAFGASGSGSSAFTADSYGTYVLRWTVTNVPCTASWAEVNVIFSQTPTASDAGPDQTGVTMCGLTSTILAANTPVTGTGSWAIIGGTGGVIISQASPTSTFTGTAGTTYVLSWTISNGLCTSADDVNITFKQTPAVTSVQTNISCFGGSGGAIDITVTGGILPYIYAWTGAGVAPSSEDQTGLAAGSYSVILTDANSCTTASFPVTITEPSVLSGSITSITNVSVFGSNDGSVTVAGSGGTAPYQYKIGSGVYQSSGTFGTLTAGAYTVTVQDINLCTFEISLIITQPAETLSGIVTSQTNVACFGASTGSVTVEGSGGTAPYEFKLDAGAYQSSGSFEALSAGTYKVTVKDAAFAIYDVSVIITQPSSAVGGYIVSQTNILCYGSNTGSVTVAGSGGTSPYKYKLGAGSYQVSGNFGTLIAGAYAITVQDANSCTFNVEATITQPQATLVGNIGAQTNVSCFESSDGSVTVTGAGGTSPYLYSLNSGTYQASGTFSGLAAATYTISVRDANLCSTNVSATIAQPAVLSLAFVTDDVSCPGDADGNIALTITGGIQPYSVIWSDGILTSDRPNISEGTYSVIVTDKNGCAANLDIVIGAVGSENCIEIPQIITPNNDGFNDTWKIKNIDLFRNAELFVYSRWGKLVFRSKNIPANPWNGTFEGKLLPTDSYHYILHLNDGSEPKSGVISVIR